MWILINTIAPLHRTTAHTYSRLLRESARQQGVKLKPGVKLLPCVGCSTAKGFSAPVKKTTECRSTLTVPAEGGEDDDTAVEGREGKSIPGGGADDASGSDDDLQVTWEVDSPEAARDVGVAAGAAGGKPETAESTGGSLREGTSTSSPSTVVSREGSFRCGAVSYTHLTLPTTPYV